MTIDEMIEDELWAGWVAPAGETDDDDAHVSACIDVAADADDAVEECCF